MNTEPEPDTVKDPPENDGLPNLNPPPLDPPDDVKPPPEPIGKPAAKKTAKQAAEAPPAEPEPAAVTTKAGRRLVTLQAEPPPPPASPIGGALTKQRIAADYYHRLNPGGPDFKTLSTNDQATWYHRSCAAKGAK